MRIIRVLRNSGKLLKLENELEITKHNNDYVVRIGRGTDRRIPKNGRYEHQCGGRLESRDKKNQNDTYVVVQRCRKERKMDKWW